MKQLGLDIGSTTLKYVLLDEENQLLSCKYQRHGAKIGEKLDEILCQFETDYPGEELILTVSGSAGLGLSESLDLPFVQEVFAEKSRRSASVRERMSSSNSAARMQKSSFLPAALKCA